MASSPPVARLNRRGRFRRWLPRVLVLVVVVGAVFGVLAFRKSKAKQSSMEAVKTEKVIRGTLVQTIASTGVVAAETGASVKIGSQISGRIKKLYVDVGKEVKAGDVIGEIDAPDIEANLQAAKRSADQAAARWQQQLQGAPMQHTQLVSAFQQATEAMKRASSDMERAKAALTSAQARAQSAAAAEEGARARLRQAEARVRSARAAVPLQSTQTSSEILRAKAALNTARSNLAQVEASANQQVASADAALKQAESNAALAAANLRRQEALLAKGFVAAADVDSARTQAEVTRQQVESATSNLNLTRAKVAAELPNARDQVEQAQAALAAAEAGSFQETIRTEELKNAESGMADALAGLEQAKQAVASAAADIKAAQAQVVAAEAEYRSAKAAQSAALGNMTQDRIKQQEIKAAYEAKRQAEAQVKFQEAQLDKSLIRTPVSGTVVSLAQQEGETVAASLAAPTLIEVVDLNRLEVRANVDETDIGQIKVGQEAEVTVDAVPRTPFKGKVTKIASSATMQENVVTYLVTVHLENVKGGMLKPQMTADVEFTVSKKENILLAPNEAIKRKKEGTQAVVLKGDKPEVRTVETGMTDGDNTEIISGLSEGETVVVAGFDKLGIQGFSSAAEVPSFMRRTPFGTPSSQKGATGKGGMAPTPTKGGTGGGPGKGEGATPSGSGPSGRGGGEAGGGGRPSRGGSGEGEGGGRPSRGGGGPRSGGGGGGP